MSEQALEWDQLVEGHAARIVRIAYRVLGSLHDAEDVAQDVFLEAYQLHQSVPVRSWTGMLVRLATLRSIDHLRRRRPSAELRDTDRASPIEPHDHLAANELATWLRDAIAKLPDQQAAAFVMVYFEQCSRAEMAAALNITPNAASAALSKARQRILAQFELSNRGASK